LQVVVRRLEVVRGEVDFDVAIQPAFDYARCEHSLRIDSESNSVQFHSVDAELALAVTANAPVAFERVTGHPLGDGASAIVSLNENSDPTVFVLGQCALEGGASPSEEDAARICDLLPLATAEQKLFVKTVGFWRKWVSQCTYQGKWREMVIRSCLVLKMLVFAPTGAILAAPTTSLPEGIGGVRQWDYRFSWIRDSSFVVDSFIGAGFVHEAARYMAFIEDRLQDLDFELERLNSPLPQREGDASSAPAREAEAPMPLQIMYTIHGGKDLKEVELPHLEGYRGSRPVRIGNGAAKQVQLDIFGELMDSIYRIDQWSEPVSYSLWLRLRKLMNWLCDNWQRKDEGVWEVRGGQQEFVYSRVMCWVALDRALRLADNRSFPADRARWTQVRDTIFEEVMERGWNADRKAFVQSYGGDGKQTLDAANLMMPLVRFISPTDPQWESTLEAIMMSPAKGGLCENSLVFRYDTTTGHDGLSGNEGTFNICTFWLVQALAQAGLKHPDRLEQAELMFEEMLGYANHLGLYAEETGRNGEGLGNFPQAFTHLALITAAIAVNRGLKGERD
jgi:GH15 family glucan-1,4-alpha-glucosidase